MSRAQVLAALLALAFAAGCSGSPGPTGPAPVAGPVSSPAEEGDRLARGGDYAGAVAKYREALGATPNDVSLRFRLGSALSQLDRHQETTEQFRWVVANGAPGQPEVAMARQWLAGGTRAPAAEGASGAAPMTEATASTAAGAESPAAPAGMGALKGKTAWPGVNPDAQRLTLEIRLAGDDDGNRDARHRLAISLGRPFEMPKIQAGAYRVLGRSKGVKLWEQRIVVSAGKDTTLDLTEANSLVQPKDFPPSGS